MRETIKQMIETDLGAVTDDLPDYILARGQKIDCVISPTSDQLAQDERGTYRAREIEIVAKKRDVQALKLGDVITLQRAEDASTNYVVQSVTSNNAIAVIRAAIVGLK